MTYTSVRLTGELPPQALQGIKALEGDLGFIADDQGLEIICERGEGITVHSDGKNVRLVWGTPVQFYRALSLIPLPPTACDIREKPRFEHAGVMFDCSRNGVLKSEAVRFFVRKMALMGLNLGMLYTEDTYEIPEQPFFGYKRGRYTFEELKALDDYAAMLGVELCPCIQTLGHLKRALHWPALHHLRDNDEVLLADVEETYTFIEQMIRAACAPFRSKLIHIGMDEAYGVGLGAHLSRFGYEDPRAVIGRHLKRVLDITDKYGLKPMMWSDMYFHLDGGGYHSEGMPSQKAIDAVDKRVSLVYWDYYHAKEEEYAHALKKHVVFGVPTVFAGGLWTWPSPAIAYPTAIENSVAGLTACMKADVHTVLATAWGDNGAECSMLTALAGMQLYGEMTYTGVYEPEALHARFARCCDANMQAFLDISKLNAAPGMVSYPSDPVNACKFMLYQDPLVELFEKDVEGFRLADYFGSLAPLYDRHSKENPAYALLFEHYAAMARALSLKCAWHEHAANAVRSGNRALAAKLADGVPDTIHALKTLRLIWRRLWESTNKPNGFEIIDVRLGGVIARMHTAQQKMSAFVAGETDDIPELSEPGLICKRRADNSISCTNTMDEIATPGRIDY